MGREDGRIEGYGALSEGVEKRPKKNLLRNVRHRLTSDRRRVERTSAIDQACARSELQSAGQGSEQHAGRLPADSGVFFPLRLSTRARRHAGNIHPPCPS